MSTTVTYKGETLTTVNNATKTLETKGTWLEDDLTLVDVSGGGSTLITKSISANGTYNASSDSADGYSRVTVAVPNSYSAGDEGKVVDSGALVAQTAHADVTPTTSDQTIDTTTNNSIKVKGDANLVAGNIKKDVVIFNTTGTYEGSGGGWSTADFLAGLAPSGAIVADSITQIGPILYNNKGITSFLSNTITKILAGNAFFGCTALQIFRITATVTQLQDGNHWQGCTSLISLELPNMTANFSSYGARGCTSLTLVDVGKTGQINANAFNGCSVLNKLIIRKTSVATLQNISAFTNTPFANGGTGGTIYVQQSLISSYQSASNWSTILGYANNSIKSIESTHTDPTAPFDMTLYYADGTPIT